MLMSKTAVDFKKVLEEKKKVVWKEIKKHLQGPLILPGSVKILAAYLEDVQFHRQIVSDYPQRQGKYLRPTLLILTAEAMGVSQRKVVKTAAAMQISEDWILIHDDFMDNSLARRGKPTLHRIYGSGLAVNAGDALHIAMWKMLRDNEKILGAQKTFELIDEFYSILVRTVLGQTTEMKWIKENKTDLTEQDCFFIIDGKTVCYSVAGPMRLGATIAGATQKQLDLIYEFARPLGRCFQIRDDLLDLTSDFRGLKKQVGNDIYEGKRTLMLMHLFKTAKPRDKMKLVEIMGKSRQRKTSDEVSFVIELMKKYKSLDYGQRLAEELASQALAIFEKRLDFLSRQPARNQLKKAVNFILKRDF